MSKTSQGYANTETEVAIICINNDPEMLEKWREEARDCQSDAAAIQQRVTDGSEPQSEWTPAMHARVVLADFMREEFLEAIPNHGGIYKELLSSAGGRIDWNEVAQDILDGLE